jgi:hypothetical protein
VIPPDFDTGAEAEHLECDHPVDVPLGWVPRQLEPVTDPGQLVLAGQPPAEPGEPGHARIEHTLRERLVQLLPKGGRRRVQSVDRGQ